MFPKITREMKSPRPPTEAFADVQTALAKLGGVKSADADTLALQGFSHYGAQRVRVEADVRADGTGALITLRAVGDDIWGYAAKNVLARLQQTVENIDNPNFVLNKTGMKGITRRQAVRCVCGMMLMFGAWYLSREGTSAGPYTRAYDWSLFGIGLVGVLATFLWPARKPRPATESPTTTANP